MENNTLVLTVGLPRSGKSSWAKGQGLPIVNPDAIRLALHGQAFYQEAEPMVWAMARLMVFSLFQAGHHFVILDATNVTKERRAMWVSEAWKTQAKIFATSAEECRKRAAATDRMDLVHVVDRMECEWEPIGEDEKIEILV